MRRRQAWQRADAVGEARYLDEQSLRHLFRRRCQLLETEVIEVDMPSIASFLVCMRYLMCVTSLHRQNQSLTTFGLGLAGVWEDDK